MLAAVSAGLGALAIVGPERLSKLPRLCLWSHLAGRPCPACGILRAVSSLLRGRWGDAWDYSPLVVPVALAIVAVGAAAAIGLLRKPRAGRGRGGGDSARA